MGMGGGAEEQVIRLSYAFKARGWKVVIVSMLPPKKMPEDFATHGVPLMHLNMRRGIPDPRCIGRLAKIIREFKPDVVHSHLVHANLLSRIVRLVENYPVCVNTHHNVTMTGVEHDRSAIFELAHRLTDRLSDRFTAICTVATDYCVSRKAVPAHKAETMPNGIDIAKFDRNARHRERLRRELGIDDKFVWLAAGRLEAQKAYPTILRAMAIDRHRSNVLLICGTGSLEQEIKDFAAELQLCDRVRFLGLRGDIPALMSAADGYALCSDFEGLPLVLLQAAAASLPIVATNVSGNPEIVIDGVNGFLVAPREPGAFFAAMTRVEQMSDAERHALGAAGRQIVERDFEAERVADRWQLMFENLLRFDNKRQKMRGKVKLH